MNIFSLIFVYSGTASRASIKRSAGQKWPAGQAFDTPALERSTHRMLSTRDESGERNQTFI